MTKDCSYSETRSLDCINCGKSFSNGTWLIVDTTENQDLIRLTREGKLHSFKCPHCGSKNNGSFPLLIFNPQEAPRLLFSPAPGSSKTRQKRHFRELISILRNKLGSTWDEELVSDDLLTLMRPELGVHLGRLFEFPKNNHDDLLAVITHFSGELTKSNNQSVSAKNEDSKIESGTLSKGPVKIVDKSNDTKKAKGAIESEKAQEETHRSGVHQFDLQVGDEKLTFSFLDHKPTEEVLSDKSKVWINFLDRGINSSEAAMTEAQKLGELADLHLKKGNTEQANQVIKKVKKLYAETMEKGHRAHEAGRFNDAIDFAKTALEISRSILRDQLSATVALMDIGAAHADAGRETMAITFYERALDNSLRTGDGESFDVATSLINLSQLRQKIGEYEVARNLAERALAIFRKHLSPSEPLFASHLSQLGELCKMNYDYEAAENYYTEALHVQRNSVGELDPLYAKVLFDLSDILRLRGRLDESERMLSKATPILSKAYGENSSEFASVLNSLGLLHDTMGSFDTAEELYKRSISISKRFGEKNSVGYAALLSNLGTLYLMTARYHEATPLLADALRIRMELLPETHPLLRISLLNLGRLHSGLRNYDEAEHYYRRDLEISQKDVFAGATLNNLGTLKVDRGRFIEAEGLLRQSLELRRQLLGPNHADVAQTWYNLSGPLTAMNQYDEALQAIKESARIHDELLQQLFGVGSEQRRLQFASYLRRFHDSFMSIVLLSGSREATDAGFEHTLRRKGIVTEVIGRQRRFAKTTQNPQFTKKLEEYNSLNEILVARIMGSPESANLDGLGFTVEELHARVIAIEEEIWRELPELDREQPLQQLTGLTICDALPAGAAFVDIVRFHPLNFKAVVAEKQKVWQPARYIAFLALSNKDRGIQLFDLGEAEPIDARIHQFRRLIAQRSHKSEFLEIGLQLRRDLLDPLVRALGNVRRLFLAPDGEIALIPFDAVPIDEERYVIDEYRVSYLSSARDLLRFRKTATATFTTSLVVADPAFDLVTSGWGSLKLSLLKLIGRNKESSNEQFENSSQASYLIPKFSRLKGTRREGKCIARMLGVTPLLGADALESQIKSHASPLILHMATHGFFLEDLSDEPDPADPGAVLANVPGSAVADRRLENPLLRSGLALAGANDSATAHKLPLEAEDGILNAIDAAALELSGTELVVLSACETGVGDARVGEGVFGLRRAFAIAGSRTLIMSLWKVPDNATQKLMEEFYRGLMQKHSRAKALRDAQLTVRRHYDAPLYWAAFICQGDPRSLEISPKTPP